MAEPTVGLTLAREGGAFSRVSQVEPLQPWKVVPSQRIVPALAEVHAVVSIPIFIPLLTVRSPEVTARSPEVTVRLPEVTVRLQEVTVRLPEVEVSVSLLINWLWSKLSSVPASPAEVAVVALPADVANSAEPADSAWAACRA